MAKLLKDWGLSLLVGLLVFFAVQWGTAPKSTGLAPDFALANVAGGTTQLSASLGQPLVINFWGSWCPPCRAEIPEFVAWHKDHPEVPILGIAARSGQASTVAEKAKALGINYTVLVANDKVLEDYGIDTYPTTIVLKADGSIASVRVGSIGRKELDQMVAKAR